ncbi:hypothetical protein FACS1894137_17620 [Spirochaetia bacterium]|nr:hypothetical protein FACS1894137_17620 [Spirochaetia bacterium]
MGFNVQNTTNQFSGRKVKSAYNTAFYRDLNKLTIDSANIILPMVIGVLPPINSAVDFGCGVGSWLSVLKQYGVKKITGFDGPWAAKRTLQIPEECFVEIELDKEISINFKYDLAISLEVAEHLPEKSAVSFVDALTKSSDFVLFSAAIPFQGGTEHVNEQWLDYWNHLFNEKGYIAVDFLRKNIWYEPTVLSTYKQNIILFVKKDVMNNVNVSSSEFCINLPPPAFVHPDFYLEKTGLITYRISRLKIVLFLKRLLKKIVGEIFFFQLKKKLAS